MFKHKIFNFLKIKEIEEIIFRAFLFLVLGIIKWIDFIDEKEANIFCGGLVFSIIALFAINDYLEIKSEKNKIINEN